MLRVFAAVRPRPIRASNSGVARSIMAPPVARIVPHRSRIDTLILRGRADHAFVTAHDIDGDFDHPSASLLQPGAEIVRGDRGANRGQRLP